MMSEIWKFKITSSAINDPILMPKGARILSVGVQRRAIVCWAVVDPLQVPVFRRIVVARTGYSHLDESVFKLPFIGTVLLDKGGSLHFTYSTAERV